MGRLHASAGIMSVGFEHEFPETVGLTAAKSGFGLIEAAILPVPRLIGPASLWPVAISFFGAVVVAAGITIGDEVSPLPVNSGVSPIAVGEPPILAEAPSVVPAPSTGVEASTGTKLPVQTVVLRGQPPSKVSRHL